MTKNFFIVFYYCMNEISFTSGIKPITLQDFKTVVSTIDSTKSVTFPWRISSSRSGKDVVTMGICDCSSCLITDGKKSLLMHLLPQYEGNHNHKKILQYISTNFDLNDKNLQAVLVGSQPEKQSMDIFKIFKNLLNTFKIPTTVLKYGKAPTSLAYKTSTDEVYISNINIEKALYEGKSKTEALNQGFEQIKLSEYDEII